MRVLLIGGTGYVGRHLLQALLAAGHQVQVGSRSADKAQLPAGATGLAMDIRDPDQVAAAVEGNDAVVHAVGLIRNRRTRGQTFERVVAEGTRHVARAAANADVRRMVLVSANGARRDGTDYQRTKWEAEEAVKKSGVPFTILRPSIVYGPDDDFTNKFRKLMRLGAVPYFGKGDYALGPVHCDDLGLAVARSLENDGAVGRTFHVCGPERVTYKELLVKIKRTAGSRALVLPVPRFLIRIAAALLGWLPFFPANNDMLTMLFEGNTCPDDEWARVLGIDPVPFSVGIRAYLGRPVDTND